MRIDADTKKMIVELMNRKGCDKKMINTAMEEIGPCREMTPVGMRKAEKEEMITGGTTGIENTEDHPTNTTKRIGLMIDTDKTARAKIGTIHTTRKQEHKIIIARIEKTTNIKTTIGRNREIGMKKCIEANTRTTKDSQIISDQDSQITGDKDSQIIRDQDREIIGDKDGTTGKKIM